MNFCWVTLHVSDLKKSLAFYHDLLGLPIASLQDQTEPKLAMLGEESQPKIELLEDPENRQTTSGISVGIAVKSLAETMEYLENKKVAVIRGPISPNPHIRFVFVADPDGYEVQLVESRG